VPASACNDFDDPGDRVSRRDLVKARPDSEELPEVGEPYGEFEVGPSAGVEFRLLENEEVGEKRGVLLVSIAIQMDSQLTGQLKLDCLHVGLLQRAFRIRPSERPFATGRVVGAIK